MKVRFKKTWAEFHRGDVVEVPPKLGKRLILQGFAQADKMITSEGGPLMYETRRK